MPRNQINNSREVAAATLQVNMTLEYPMIRTQTQLTGAITIINVQFDKVLHFCNTEAEALEYLKGLHHGILMAQAVQA